MPHTADHLARLFRDSGAWSDLEQWFVDYSLSNWGQIDWAVASFGRMFPSSDPGDGVVKSHFASVLTSGTSSLAICSLASQRLAAWDKDLARNVIREAAEKTTDPLQRRALALSAHAAKDERNFIRKLLRETEETRVTLDMLNDCGFRRVKAVPDFSGG